MCINLQPYQDYIRSATLITIPQPCYPSPTFLYVPVFVLRPDLCRMDLIPGNFVDTTTCTCPTPLNQIENIPTDTVLPPVPTSLLKIESGGFIEMEHLIPTLSFKHK